MTDRAYTVAIVGATGVVGGTVRAILEERAFPVGELRLLASERSRGAQLPFRGASCTVAELSAGAFAGVDLAFFAAGGAVSKEFVPPAVAAGAVAIDKSSAFRADPARAAGRARGQRRPPRRATRASSPRPTARPSRWWSPSSRSTTPPASSASSCRTYQSVSGSGKRGVDDLDRQARAWATGDDPAARLLSAPDRLQPAAPHRQLPRRRLDQGRAEDGRRDGQDLRRPADQGHRDLRAGAGLRGALRVGQRADPRAARRRRGARAAGRGARRRGRSTTPPRPLPHAARRRGQGPGLRGPHPRRRHGAQLPQLLGGGRQPAQGRGAERRADRRGARRRGACCERGVPSDRQARRRAQARRATRASTSPSSAPAPAA